MSVKDLFNKTDKLLSSVSLNELGSEIESADYVETSIIDKNRFIPHVDYSKPENFAFYGLAEQYYLDSIKYIYSSYPYDGSKNEHLKWEVSSSYLDLYMLNNEYPRSTGYVNMGINYGDQVGGIQNNWGSFGSNNYIFTKGGPHTASEGMIGTPLYQTFINSNVYDNTKNRESNLQISGSSGITFEFWLKKTGWTSGSESPRQVICDIWNSASLSSNSYGRCRVEIRPGVANSQRQFYIELLSGTAGLSSGSSENMLAIGSGLEITGSTWKQYSLSIINSGSSMVASLYTSGTLNHSLTTGSSIGLITGSMISSIGSLITTTSGSNGALGWGKLSGSLDEFRFWKIKRNATQIGRNWFCQVGAGSNSDEANTTLGVYYKFNEGIMNTSSVHALDTKVLDYSGRVSNGNWIGYVTGSRNTGSAIMDASASVNEFRDPILYSEHTGVVNLISQKQEIGFAHDTTNNSNIYASIPEWILDEDKEKGKEVLLKLTQTMASYLDNLHIQIKSLPDLKTVSYVSSSYKPYPFVTRFLEPVSLITPEIFNNANAPESLASRDDFREYTEKLSDVKNKIYQNIYNNLSYIYKSKGTEKSFRNLIRCFGIDEELIKVNLYGDNVTYDLKDNKKYTSVRKKYADFNHPDKFDCTVYQHTSSATSSRSYIASPSNIIYQGNTYQVEVIFPKKFEVDSELFFDTPFITSSIFGAHTVLQSTASNTNKSWVAPDNGNFQVLAIRPSVESKDVKFMLTGTQNYLLPALTSSLFQNVYNNEKWNLAVKIKPKSYPWADGVTGSAGNLFDVEFVGFNNIMDITASSFILTGTMSQTNAIMFMTSSRSFYVGAHRQDFTGSVLSYSDLKISSLRVWMKYLDNNVILNHAQDALNYGIDHPMRNTYLTEQSRSFGVGI